MLWENGINGILADEMGLGKTVQCIATIALMIQRGVPGPFLVCGPLSTLPNWMAEFQRFTPEVRHFLLLRIYHFRCLFCCLNYKYINFCVNTTSYLTYFSISSLPTLSV